MRIFYCPPPDGESLLLSLLRLLVFNPGNWLSAAFCHQDHFLTRHTAWPLLVAGICRLTQECRRRSSSRRRRRRRSRGRGTGPMQAGTGEIAVSAGKEPLKQISECWNWRRPAINNTRYVLKMSRKIFIASWSTINMLCILVPILLHLGKQILCCVCFFNQSNQRPKVTQVCILRTWNNQYWRMLLTHTVPATERANRRQLLAEWTVELLWDGDLFMWYVQCGSDKLR